jgi:hypothetical protein
MDKAPALPPQRLAMLQWTARMGAVTAEALATHDGVGRPAARSRLIAGGRAGLLSRTRPLTGQPALYTVTKAGLRASGLSGLLPCRVSPSNAQHLIVCAAVAAALEIAYPDHDLLGEPELRTGAGRASAATVQLLATTAARQRTHRPDLALWPAGASGGPVVVEVELTVKAPRRLAEICLAWARSRHVSGVIYIASPAVERALEGAIRKARAGDRIVVLPLAAVAPADACAAAGAIPVGP